MWYTSLVQMPEGTLSTYLSSNCCKTAKRESTSGLQPQGPSLRFFPQRKQMPLQSGLHRSWLSRPSTKAVVTISVRSAQPSWMPKVHSSSACSSSCSGTRTAWTGIVIARVNAARRSGRRQRADLWRSQPLKRGHRRCCAPCRAQGPARLQACSCRKQDRTDLRSSRTEGLRRA